MECNTDRLAELLANAGFTGIDFVYVHENQTQLDVHFHTQSSPPVLDGITAEDVEIYQTQQGPGQGVIPIASVNWSGDDTLLIIETEYPGGFENYTLHLDDARVDLQYNDYVFSFKANCPSDLDCKPRAPYCPEEEEVDFPVNYLARDFWSFRQALLDFATQRYPDWQDRLEADAGMMLLEIMSAMGDDASYIQDRYAREAYLETASQRRSLKHHAQLMDYRIGDGLAAFTWIDVNTGGDGHFDAGTLVYAEAESSRRVEFEIGRNIDEILAVKSYFVRNALNALDPHCWDEDEVCLPIGSTEVSVDGHVGALIDGLMETDEDGVLFKSVLLTTDPVNKGIPARNIIVDIIDTFETTDPLTSTNITRLTWRENQALVYQLDIEALQVHANILPVIAGRLHEDVFVIGLDTEDPELIAIEPDSVARSQLSRAIERQGASYRDVNEHNVETTRFMFSLLDSEETPLCWQGEEQTQATPDVRLFHANWNNAAQEWQALNGANDTWDYVYSFISGYSSQEEDRHFALEHGHFRPVISFHRDGQIITHTDYMDDKGFTIRFGETGFGKTPSQGTIFKVFYRLGNGTAANVATNTLEFFEADLPNFIPPNTTITNPLAVTSGEDPETVEQIRHLVPQAYQSETYRAVRAEDYAEAAERLEWVQRAGAKARYTGAWTSMFVTVDPSGATSINDEKLEALEQQMDRFRQAGRQVYTSEPDFADIDLKITICVEPYAYRGEVKERVLKLLLGDPSTATNGFFHPDNFTFGTPLYRAQLEATIHEAEGVRAVTSIYIRRRGYFGWRLLDGLYHPIGVDEVIRLENDLDYPERGTLNLYTVGGA